MILGKIVGKTSTREFKFSIDKDVEKFEYTQVIDKNGNTILCQILEIENNKGQNTAFCNIIGYRDKSGRLRNIRTPLEAGTEVSYAEDQTVKNILGLGKSKNAAYIGTLDGRDKLKVFLDLNKLLTKHVAVLAKTGAGKCVDPKTQVILQKGKRIEIGKLVDDTLKNHLPKREGTVEFVENKKKKMKVLSLDKNNKIKLTPIKAFMRRKSPKYIYSITTKNGQNIKLTAKHPVPILKSKGIHWIQASKLIQEDYVLIGVIPQNNSKITKRERMDKISSKIYKKLNKEIKIPNINLIIRQLAYLLRMDFFKIPHFSSYAKNKKRLTKQKISQILNKFQSRYEELKNTNIKIKESIIQKYSENNHWELRYPQDISNEHIKFFNLIHNKNYLENNSNKEIIFPRIFNQKSAQKLFEEYENLDYDLFEAKKRIKFLSQLLKSNLSFDQVVSVKKIKSKSKYVYDLETENHNFVANNLVIHNSYVTGVLLEELLENKIPIVIIDPHGEYNTLKYPNDKDEDKMKKFDISPKGYLKQIQEFSPDIETNPECKPLKLNNENLSPSELIHMMPAKLSNAQMGVLYSASKNLGNRANFDDLLFELENEDSNVKWTLINILEYIRKLNLFSDAATPIFELVKPGKASIINLKGVSPEVQEVVVYKLVKDLFMERKKGNIPPFFLVLEEGHNFIPERTYGETKSSAILRQIFSEGRKFGLGVCLISQRPGRVEKNALSQVNTQIILKVTNPNDIKAIANSVEGITSETEKEIKNIPIGTALITGVVDLPIFVNIRSRRSKHGGAAIKILDEDTITKEETDFIAEAQESKGELIPIIKQKISIKDLKLMGKKDIKVNLIPCLFLSCSDEEGDFNLLINLNNGQIINSLETGKGVQLKGFNLNNLSPQQSRILRIALKLKEFKPADLFAKSGLQFSDLYDTIKVMKEKGFFVQNGDKYSLSEKISFFTNLRKYAFYGKVDYSNIKFDKQKDKNVDSTALIQFLNRFIKIKNEVECWLIIYE